VSMSVASALINMEGKNMDMRVKSEEDAIHSAFSVSASGSASLFWLAQGQLIADKKGQGPQD